MVLEGRPEMILVEVETLSSRVDKHPDPMPVEVVALRLQYQKPYRLWPQLPAGGVVRFPLQARFRFEV